MAVGQGVGAGVAVMVGVAVGLGVLPKAALFQSNATVIAEAKAIELTTVFIASLPHRLGTGVRTVCSRVLVSGYNAKT
jgi:hypothetical protein